MVNTRFPHRIGYGFEMVDAASAWIRPRKAGINRKFTPIQINRVFRQFSAA
jgi:hypothetical protein